MQYFSQIMATVVFGLAVVHTCLSPSLLRYFKNFRTHDLAEKSPRLFCVIEFLCIVNSMELVLVFWLVPLFGLLAFTEDWQDLVNYVENRNYQLVLYVVVIVVLAASAPIISFGKKVISIAAKIGKNKPEAWWCSILMIAPILGSLLKETLALILATILLKACFYRYLPGRKFCYATLGLLFTNISVGGMCTAFSSPAMLLASSSFDWGWFYLLSRFIWKVGAGLVITTGVYYYVFRKEFKYSNFPKVILPNAVSSFDPPFWFCLLQLIFLLLVIICGRYVSILIAIFLAFLVFFRVTSFYQKPLNLKLAIKIGCFLASLMIHGELQGWWVVAIMERVHSYWSILAGVACSSLLDTTVVVYLVSQDPSLLDFKRYLWVSGAMLGGGLTIFGNVANPFAIKILSPHMRVSLLGLFVSALFPAAVYLLLFLFL